MSTQTCPRCGVVLIGEEVRFSNCPWRPYSRQHLYARVCQFVLERGLPGCINTKVDPQSTKPEHGYGCLEGLHPEVVAEVTYSRLDC